MTTIRRFHMNDLFKFNNVNLDVLTETYNMTFYLSYMSKWPESFTVAEAPSITYNSSNDSTTTEKSETSSSIMGYMISKAEGVNNLWHGHVSAVTVSPTYRRLGLAKTLMDDFEHLSTNVYNAFFVDLFVRASNELAISMYEKFGYVKYRRVLGYYSGATKDTLEDAWDMRKALERDVKQESVVPLDHPVLPQDLEW